MRWSTSAWTRSPARSTAARQGAPDQVGGEHGAGAGQQLLGGLGVEFDGPLLDGTVGEHHHQQRVEGREADQLDGADGGRLVGGADHDRRVRGQLGEQPRGPLEHRLHFAVHLLEELGHLSRWTGPRTPGAVRWSTKKR